MSGKRFDPSKANKLIDSKRYKLHDPNKLIEVFGVEEGEVVADLGAGNGFFTIPLGEKTKTIVYAVDIEPKMLERLRERANEANVENIQYVISDLEKVNLDDHSVDKAFISLVLHEVLNLQKVLTEVKRILKTKGRVFILEWEALESEMGPPLHERISSSNMIEILKKQGFAVEISYSNDTIYGLTGIVN
ncbi:class I SAM-dependent methyltransferase [Oceanobacillus sp. CAU 1775]